MACGCGKDKQAVEETEEARDQLGLAAVGKPGRKEGCGCGGSCGCGNR